ncbi:hypothetical protein DFH08DRAFT_818878 [Mycena albidolilacea]|uniref:DUF6589 domain-containing protein n=1 Tax=Mycena albidolilacea TaxID=1033008 RepID=A0AAD7EFK6_9AGAR|nr:hypothetical protein DFH08DRAFT_818878 [Mycena albidolilacea]
MVQYLIAESKKVDLRSQKGRTFRIQNTRNGHVHHQQLRVLRVASSVSRYPPTPPMEAYEGNPQLVIPYTPPPHTPPGFSSVLTVHSYQSNGHFLTDTTPSTSTQPVSSEYCWNTPITFAPINTPPSGTPKRQRAMTINDENTPPTPADSHSSKKAKTSGTSTRRKPRSAKEKVQLILESIQDQGWTLGEFLHQIFDHQGRDGSRSQTHAQMIRSFLGGHGKYTPSDILTCWMTSPDDIVLAAYDPNLAKIYSSDTPYPEIGPVRPDVLCTPNRRKLLGPRQNAVKKSGWLRIGQNTIPFVADILEHHLRPAFYLLERIAMRKPRNRNGDNTCPSRPLVLPHKSRQSSAARPWNTLFGCSVPADIMAYNSRTGTMPSYSTVYKQLEALSIEEALVTSAHGTRVRDHRIGRENHMNVGMSGLWVEAWDIINVHVFDLSDKRQRISCNERASLSVDRIFSFLDQEDADTTGYLGWLEVLVRGKKDTIPFELKVGLEDFLKQIGQTAEGCVPRKLIIGGDGLSYAMILQFQNYLQWHKDPFKSFEILEPQLQVWHTKWTDIIRIFQTHWACTSGKSTNPASLGHSARKIGRAALSNMKKVEFYPGSQLLYLVLDARMLDGWRLLLGVDNIFEHFDTLSSQKKLPDFEELVEIAKKLHHTYSTARARDHAYYMGENGFHLSTEEDLSDQWKAIWRVEGEGSNRNSTADEQKRG